MDVLLIMAKDKSEDIRLRYLYRNMIVMGKAKISLEGGRALVGPDCAYHLYGFLDMHKRKPRLNRSRK